MTFPTWPTPLRRSRDQRGAVLPSPVVLLSILAVAVAAIAFLATRSDDAGERDISATKAAASPSDTASAAPTEEASKAPAPEKPKPKPVNRGANTVVVFNNTSIKGLAGRVSQTVKDAGWKVGATDNWYGTVSATTVYYPQGKKAAGRQLALDLGIARILPADTNSDMSSTNLTLILTGELD